MSDNVIKLFCNIFLIGRIGFVSNSVPISIDILLVYKISNMKNDLRVKKEYEDFAKTVSIR